MQKSDTKDLKHEGPALLPTNKSREALKNLDGWQATGDNKMIYRDFILHDFMTAVDMIEDIAGIAQKENHHPDIHLTQFRNLRVTLSTHDVGGLSQKDFTVATKLNEMTQDHPTPKPVAASQPPIKRLPIKKAAVKKATVKKAAVKKAAVKKAKAKAVRTKERI